MERLENRARAAYEHARLREAVVSAWPVPLLAVLALTLGGERGDIALAAAILILAVVALRWRGGALGRGVTAGLFAGAVPLVMPYLAVGAAGACSASCSLWCAWSCVVGGLAGVGADEVGEAVAEVARQVELEPLRHPERLRDGGGVVGEQGGGVGGRAEDRLAVAPADVLRPVEGEAAP